MTLTARILTAAARGLISATCRVDDRELGNMPMNGPLLVLFNHINFLEVPLIRTRTAPRDVYALTKQETWKNPIFRILADNWGGIPIDRANPAVSSMRNAEKVLHEGKILFIAPEGTRTVDGSLRQGNPGIASIAIRTGAPILPLAHYGGESWWKNLKHFRRTDVTLRIGPVVRLKLDGRVGRQVRQDITDQLMYEIAKLLPESYRGYYREPKPYETSYLTYA